MILAIVMCAVGLIALGCILTVRYIDARTWQRSLVAFRLSLPSDLGVEQVMNWLSNVAASTHPPLLSLAPVSPVAVEIVASSHGIAHYVLISRQAGGTLLAG